MDARPVLDLIAAAQSGDGVVLVGIGGHGGAGKSTLARMIPGAQVVSTDEFWTGASFDIDRIAHEVLAPIARGEPAHFASYDWSSKQQRGSRMIEPAGIVVIEGVCALHKALRESYAVRVWVEAPYDLRLARGIARDGEAARSVWVDVWMPSEERYVERDDPVRCAHIVIDTGETPAKPE
jgi:uridine kinase